MIPLAKFAIKTLATIVVLAVGQPIFAQSSTTIPSWTSSDGKTIKAKFVRIEEDSVVIEKEGKPFTIHFSKLAPASVELAKSLNEKITNNKGDEKVDIDPFSDLDLSRDSRITQGDSPGVAYIKEKLRRIVIPSIDFKDVTLDEAIDILRQRSVELDTLELDPAKKGVNFVIRRHRSAAPDAYPGSLRICELRVQQVSLADTLQYICDQTKLRFKVHDYSVMIESNIFDDKDLLSRTFKVPPDFHDRLFAVYGNNDVDTADERITRKRKKQNTRITIEQLLKISGITFGEGRSARIINSRELSVVNTELQLDKIESIVSSFSEVRDEPQETHELPNL
jgi:hypothetical protein